MFIVSNKYITEYDTPVVHKFSECLGATLNSRRQEDDMRKFHTEDPQVQSSTPLLHSQ